MKTATRKQIEYYLFLLHDAGEIFILKPVYQEKEQIHLIAWQFTCKNQLMDITFTDDNLRYLTNKYNHLHNIDLI